MLPGGDEIELKNGPEREKSFLGVQRHGGRKAGELWDQGAYFYRSQREKRK